MTTTSFSFGYVTANTGPAGMVLSHEGSDESDSVSWSETDEAAFHLQIEGRYD